MTLTVEKASTAAAPRVRKPLISKAPRSLWLILAVAAIGITVASTQSSYTVLVLNTALLACIGALALNLLMGTAGQISIGNAAFLALGAFGAVFAQRAGWAFPVDVVFGTAVAALGGLVVAIPALRIRGLYLALVSLAATFIVAYVAHSYQSSAVGEGAFIIEPVFRGGLLKAQQMWTWTLLPIVAVVIVMVSVLMRGKSGRTLRLIRDHEVVAGVVGVRVAGYKFGVFAFTSGLIGMQGALSVHLLGSLSSTTFTLVVAISYVAMVFIGGIDTLWGPVIGAFVVIGLPLLIPQVFGVFGGADSFEKYVPQLTQIIYGGLVIVFATAVQGGLVGAVKRSVQSWFNRRNARNAGGVLPQ